MNWFFRHNYLGKWNICIWQCPNHKTLLLNLAKNCFGLMKISNLKYLLKHYNVFICCLLETQWQTKPQIPQNFLIYTGRAAPNQIPRNQYVLSVAENQREIIKERALSVLVTLCDFNKLLPFPSKNALRPTLSQTKYLTAKWGPKHGLLSRTKQNQFFSTTHKFCNL